MSKTCVAYISSIVLLLMVILGYERIRLQILKPRV